MEKIFMYGNEELSCKDIRKPEIASVYGVMKKAGNYNIWCINAETAQILLKNESAEYISGNGIIDWECYETYLLDIKNEERAINLLKNSGITFELYFVKGEYILVKDFFNMSNAGVQTDIYMTDDYKKENCYEKLWGEE